MMRKLKPEDLSVCESIVLQNYASRVDAERAVGEMRMMFSDQVVKPTFFVVEEDGEVVGFAGFVVSWIDDDVYELFWVNVHPSFQGKGFGKLLVSGMLGELKRLHARKVIISVSKKGFLESFYTKYGFSTLGQISDDSILMSLSL